jgi:site-specific DNA-methyltransferase (adenine-specific)
VSYVAASDAKDFLVSLKDESVDLFLIDPPYFGIVRDLWDNQWPNSDEYAAWLVGLCTLARQKVKPAGSLIMFQAIGRHQQHPIFQVISGVEREGWCFRNWITWKKARAFGRRKDYLFGRDEILWFSASADPGAVTFNVPFTDQKTKRPTAKHAFRRVTNVWDDIELVNRPERSCRRPLPLLGRLIKAHTNAGDLVVDFFAGYGSTGIVAHNLGRRFLGCEAIETDAQEADRRVAAVARQRSSA